MSKINVEEVRLLGLKSAEEIVLILKKIVILMG